MGKYWILVCVGIWLSSCAIEHTEPMGPDCYFANMAELSQWVMKTPYVSDWAQFSRAEYWQNPEQFWSNGRGDCEDRVIFIIWYARKWGVNYRMASVDWNGSCHAMLELDGVIHGLDGHSVFNGVKIYDLCDWNGIKHRIGWD